jgi:hypothetical protein
MATWKKILVEGDAVASNLATDDLTQEVSSRIYILNGDNNRLSFKGGITQMIDSSNGQEFSFDTVNRVFDVHYGNSIRFREDDDTNYVAVKANPTVSADYTITLPGSAPGGANKILESNANGVLSWIDTPSGGGSVTINSNVNNYLVTASGSANTLNGESNLTYSTDLSITNGKIKIATNDKFIEGKHTGGASFPLIGINASDEVVVGNTTSRAVTLEGVATITRGVNNDSSALSSIGHYGSGADITFLGAAQTSVYQGRLYYWNGTTWTAYTLATEPPQGTLLGVSIGTTMASGFVLRGMVYSGSSLSTGKPVYGDQGATPTTTPPTSGFQRIIGHSVSTNVYYFNPSQEYIEIAE